jgi:hypothetical protein
MKELAKEELSESKKRVEEFETAPEISGNSLLDRVCLFRKEFL